MINTICRWIVIMSMYSGSSFGQTLAQRLLADYDRIGSVSCEIRKDGETPAGTTRRLSRVYFQRPDLLHVDSVTPIKRRIVANGTHLYSYIEGDPKGFSRPISELGEDWLISLRNVPGSPVEHLLKLKDAPETELPAVDGFPVRKGYQTERLFVVLALDATNRLALIEFYNNADMAQKTAQYVYRSFQEAVPGIWLALVHEATLWAKGIEIKETTRISNLAVDQPIAPSLFVESNFFKEVEFVDSMDKIYPK